MPEMYERLKARFKQEGLTEEKAQEKAAKVYIASHSNRSAAAKRLQRHRKKK